MEKDHRRAAKYISAQLKAVGFEVHHRYSKTTDSAYLTLENSLLGVLRISDHLSKRFHQYNLVKGEKRRTEITRQGTRCYFAPYSDVEVLIAKIKYDHQQLINELGEHEYKKQKFFRLPNGEKNELNIVRYKSGYRNFS
ncbi:hypothetical protein ACFVT8_23445 [Lysinibacillus sp. NPDC058147]|uniref:hypothetical protein n=1 Tax=unclassified Lysinibacillus TaxID=2636778 RepID=UPI0036DA2AA4